jgi:hypothetical protein
VNVWFALGGVLLVAVKVKAYAAAVPAAGVPLSVPVPLPLSTKVTPDGNAAPVRAIVGAGNPVVVTVNVPAEPTVKLTVVALVIAGAWFTVSVNACAGLAPIVLVAVMEIAYVPPVPAAAVPLKVPVPLPWSAKVNPAGSAPPPIASVGVGSPLVVTVKDPATPIVKVALAALVMTVLR